jgi:opacity protein-like surface antigen
MSQARIVAWSSLLVALFTATPLGAQPTPPPNLWSHGTTLSVAGGTASASSDTGGQISTSIGWEITPRLGIEGTGSWLDRRNGAEAFAATLSVQASLLPPHLATPFVQAGYGLYHASFDVSRSAIPGFYRDRITTAMLGSVTDVFNDPAFTVGGGVNVFVTHHIAIRPEVAALVVARNSQTYVVATAAVRAAYHFEQHPTRPSRAVAQRR